MERARCMRLHASLPLEFWTQAVDTVVYLINRGPSTALDGGILEEEWIGKKVDLSYLKVFGCEAFVHIDKENRKKLDAKSMRCTFIGYGSDDFGFRLWNLETNKVIRSRDVVFNEKVMYCDQLRKLNQTGQSNGELDEVTVQNELADKRNNHLQENIETDIGRVGTGVDKTEIGVGHTETDVDRIGTDIGQAEPTSANNRCGSGRGRSLSENLGGQRVVNES